MPRTDLVLALARIWYTAETGAIGSKAHAADCLPRRRLRSAAARTMTPRPGSEASS
ncbi:MAG: DUF4111 domain-containing protein [Comamonadaceae bacterium]|uniref:DUF4111 domain-containing protein n=1 Tax=Hydrogenophaga borbori TaxID=2294117 RepID=A0A372EPZ7_9BURK|nr:DUF4111 domain-containing protein [Comamonadaceae bacterium]RFP82596.1 DUF4111 domain-containing protein [Hydrogenophaga borbori]